MREENPPLLRNNLDQVLLDLFRVRILRQVEALREPLHVRVHHNAGRDPERCAQHNVRRLPRYPRQRQQLLHRVRHFASKFFHNHLAGPDNGLRFIAEKAGGANVLLKLFWVCVSERLRPRILWEKRRRHLIHTLIGALCRKNRRNQQLKRVFVSQCAGNGRVSLVELFKYGANACRIGSTRRASARAHLRAAGKGALWRRNEFFLRNLFLWLGHEAKNYSTREATARHSRLSKKRCGLLFVPPHRKAPDNTRRHPRCAPHSLPHGDSLPSLSKGRRYASRSSANSPSSRRLPENNDYPRRLTCDRSLPTLRPSKQLWPSRSPEDCYAAKKRFCANCHSESNHCPAHWYPVRSPIRITSWGLYLCELSVQMVSPSRIWNPKPALRIVTRCQAVERRCISMRRSAWS